MTRRQRLARLGGRLGPLRGGVVNYGQNETPDEAAARAIASGRIGPFLLIPEPIPLDVWLAQSEKLPAYQAECKLAFEAAEALRRTAKDPG